MAKIFSALILFLNFLGRSYASEDVEFDLGSVPFPNVGVDVSKICPYCPLHMIYTGRCGVLEGCEALGAPPAKGNTRPASSLNVWFIGNDCNLNDLKSGFIMRNTLRVQG